MLAYCIKILRSDRLLNVTNNDFRQHGTSSPASASVIFRHTEKHTLRTLHKQQREATRAEEQHHHQPQERPLTGLSENGQIGRGAKQTRKLFRNLSETRSSTIGGTTGSSIASTVVAGAAASRNFARVLSKPSEQSEARSSSIGGCSTSDNNV